jgi:hypothetical protein
MLRLFGFASAQVPSTQAAPSYSTSPFHKVRKYGRRKHHRVKLLPLHAVRFELDGEEKGVELGNLSVSGMGLYTSDLPSGIKSGDLIQGCLVSSQDRVQVQAKVVYVSRSVTGCQFVEHDTQVNRWVQSYFNLEITALNMISVNPTLLQEDPEGTPHWIHGKNNCELFFISNGDRVVRFNLTFFGNYVEGGEGVKPKYGQIIEEDGIGKPRHKSAALIRWDASIAEQLEIYATRFLSAIPHLDEVHRKEIAKMLNLPA